MSEPVDIKEVTSKQDWRDFFSVRKLVYRDDPAAVLPLQQMELLQLDKDKHPFYLHADRQIFVAYRNGKPIGRVAAIVDHLHNEHYGDKVGFFGFFETVNEPEVARRLLDAARTWLVKQGRTAMRGPVNPSMKGEFGVLVEGNENVPFVMMGHSPRYYEDLLLQNGFQSIKEFYCYRYFTEADDLPTSNWDKVSDFVRKCETKFPEIQRRAVTKENFEQVIHDVNRLGNIVRAENFGFVPLTPKELDQMVAQLRRVIRYDMIVAYYCQNKIVGFIINIPDVNWALKKTIGTADWVRMPQLLYWLNKSKRCRVIALGVDPEHRKKGIAIRMIYELIVKAKEYRDWEFSWVVEDNVKSMRVIRRTMNLVQYKTYRIYEMPLEESQ